MRIIELKTLNNGAHRNQILNNFNKLPLGWAIIPENIVTDNFPFGTVIAENINGIMTVTEWIPGEIPLKQEIMSPSFQREQIYNTEKIIEWDNSKITVTKAAQLWQYYAAEGSLKANILSNLISEAKQTIRQLYPD